MKRLITEGTFVRLELGSRLVEQRTNSGFAQGPSSMAWKKFREDYWARRIRGRGFNLAVRECGSASRT